MNDIPGQDNSWTPCPPGLIQEVAVKAAQARQQFFLWCLSLAAIALFVIGASISYFSSNSVPPNSDPALTCAQVQQHFCALVRGEISCCVLQQKITRHLGTCSECRCQFNDLCCAASHDPDRPKKINHQT